MSNLYHRLGGDPALHAAVEGFYRRVTTDPRTARFFEGVDVGALSGKQEGFMRWAFGGTAVWAGRGLRETHRPLVRQGLGDVEFDAVVELLEETLVELQVDPALIGEVLFIVGSTRHAVLDR